MGSVNVNRNVTDTFYRYKMPRLVAKVEGKGNGIKTVIVNMPDIAKALNRPPTYPTKYFGCELGAQTQIDNKNERYIVNGDHDAGKLQDILDGFIQRYVLCPECENPETDLVVRKQLIFQSCKACGNGRTIELTHRLSTYIVKNPPGGDAADKPGKKDKRSKKSKGEDAKPNNGLAGDVQQDGDAKDGSKEGSEEDQQADDDDWAVDPEDAELRKQEMTGAMAALTANEDMERPEDERLDMFLNFVKKQQEETGVQLDGRVLATEAERLDVKDKGVLVLCRCVLDEDVLSQVKAYRTVFLRFTVNNPRGQRYLLGGVEQLIVAHKETLLPKTKFILKALYDVDVVEEQALLEWGQKGSKRFVSKEENKEIRDQAEPFLTWLAEAEEESSDEEEDEVQVEFGEEATAKQGTGGGRGGKKASEGSTGIVEEDFDIDDI